MSVAEIKNGMDASIVVVNGPSVTPVTKIDEERRGREIQIK
jgi:hypothetical protein